MVVARRFRLLTFIGWTFGVVSKWFCLVLVHGCVSMWRGWYYVDVIFIKYVYYFVTIDCSWLFLGTRNVFSIINLSFGTEAIFILYVNQYKRFSLFPLLSSSMSSSIVPLFSFLLVNVMSLGLYIFSCDVCLWPTLLFGRMAMCLFFVLRGIIVIFVVIWIPFVIGVLVCVLFTLGLVTSFWVVFIFNLLIVSVIFT